MKYRPESAESYIPPENCPTVLAVDSHTGGEPFRVIISGLPAPEGATMLERRRYAMENLDHYRRALMLEPRGHADMYGCLMTPPVSPTADLGVLFLHNEGFSSMCGHGIIALSTVVLETGIIRAKEPETLLRFDTPAGMVTARAVYRNGRVGRVRFENVPSFVVELDSVVSTGEYGDVRYDLAYGGAFYAYVNAEDIGLSCGPSDLAEIISAGKLIKNAVEGSREIEHPTERELSFLYGVIFVCGDDPRTSKNICVFADGEVDRSPTGTGVSGRLAIHYVRGEIGIGEPIEVESITRSVFSGEIVGETEFSGIPSVVPSIEGYAFITGRHEFYIDPEDEIGAGFLLR